MEEANRKYISSIDILPYEKFIKFGPESLSEAELLAIIIRTGAIGISPIEISMNVLRLCNIEDGLLGLHQLSLQQLMEIKGIGEVKAVKIKCICELSKRIATSSSKKGLLFTSPSSIAKYYMEQMRHLQCEKVLLLLLDGKNKLIMDVCISQGTVNASLLSTREVFIQALQYHAVYLLLLHNHPSGDPTPSKQDIAITSKIKEASILMDIPLVDHIIIGDNEYTSLREKGYL